MIVDGVHVDPAMLRLALRGACASDAGDRRDAAGRRQPRKLPLYGEEIIVRDGRCMRDDGTLAGAMLDMATAVRNCVRLLGVSLETALRFASTIPRAFSASIIAWPARAGLSRRHRRHRTVQRHRSGNVGCGTCNASKLNGVAAPMQAGQKYFRAREPPSEQ